LVGLPILLWALVRHPLVRRSNDTARLGAA
jgi:hypothetical protein